MSTRESPRAATLADLSAALAAVERVLEQNRHRGDAWQHAPVFSHARHAEAHLACWRESRNVEDLVHGACRALMALQNALAAEAGPAPKGAA